MSPKLKYWYVQTPDGEKIGPYDQHELRELLRDGKLPLTVGIRTRNEGKFIAVPLHPQGDRFLDEDQRLEGRRLCRPPIPEVEKEESVMLEEEGEPPAETVAESTVEEIPAPQPQVRFEPRLQASERSPSCTDNGGEKIRLAGAWLAGRLQVARSRFGILIRLRQLLWFCIPSGSVVGVLVAFLWLRYPSSTQLIIAALLGAVAGWFVHNPDAPKTGRANKERPAAPEVFRSVQEMLDYNARCQGQEVVREQRRRRRNRRPRRQASYPPIVQFLLSSLVINASVAAVYLPLAWKMHFAFGCTFQHYLKVALTFGAWDPMVVFAYAAIIFLNAAVFWIIFVVNGRV